MLVSVPLVFELIFVVMLAVMLKQTQEIVRRETRSRAVVAEANQLSRCLFDAGTSLVAWKYFRSDMFTNRERESVSQFESGLSRLKKLTAEDVRQTQHVLKLESMGHTIIGLFAKYHQIATEKVTYPTLEPMQRLQFVQHGLNPFLAEVQSLDREESRIIDDSPLSAAESQQRLDQLLIAGVLSNILLAVVLASFFSKEITSRIAILIENSKRLANQQPLHDPLGGTDEVAELDTVFHQMADALALSERRRSEFVEMISHDLRSPLSAIQLTLAMVAKGSYGKLSEKGADRVADAERSSESLIALINELLDVEKLASGSFELETSELSIASLIGESVDAVKPLADEKNLKISIKCNEQLRVTADKPRLMRVIINLLSNAIKFSPDGKTISVTASELNDLLKVAVNDEGPGIALADQDKIFEQYEQVHKSNGSDSPQVGSGLGLAICKALVLAHRGKIWVESEKGKGSTFCFEIPTTTG